MSKHITYTETQIDEILKELESKLRNGKLASGTIALTQDKLHEKATVYFTPQAWTKTFALVDELPGEVGWNGIAKRIDIGEYVVEDVLVYPQEVTAATVETDTEELMDWQMELSDEEFANLRFQGHSHVKMSVTPSTTDKDNRELLMSQHKVSDDTDYFFIFAIFNKDKKISGEIYDFRDNVIYEDTDITFIPIDDVGNSISDWLKESLKLVKKPVPKVTTSTYTSKAITASNEKNKASKESKKETKHYGVAYPTYDEYYDYDDYRYDGYLGGYYNGYGSY